MAVKHAFQNPPFYWFCDTFSRILLSRSLFFSGLFWDDWTMVWLYQNQGLMSLYALALQHAFMFCTGLSRVCPFSSIRNGRRASHWFFR